MNAAPVARPRVLLVDDNASLRRLVAMMLEGQPIDLVTCADVAQALAVLRQEPVQLLITDWMMPGESGEALLQTLRDEPALRGTARLVVFSAGLGRAAEDKLPSYGVWRVLAKPVSLQDMEACVCEGLGLRGPEREAIERHFGGQTALFAAFKADCLQQFAADLHDGDEALRNGDVAALRRLAHTLKSVLLMLGETGAGADAQRLEADSAAADEAAMQGGWQRLRETLLRLHAQRV